MKEYFTRERSSSYQKDYAPNLLCISIVYQYIDTKESWQYSNRYNDTIAS
jgi:hypothetical protein